LWDGLGGKLGRRINVGRCEMTGEIRSYLMLVGLFIVLYVALYIVARIEEKDHDKKA